MTPELYLTQPALHDIEGIADYIASQSGLEQGERFLSKLDAKLAKIAQFPNLGRLREEILPKLRSVSMDSYLIFYTVMESRVEILRVVNGYRDLTALFSDSDN